MSMTMETGELIGFHVSVGQEVKAGDVLFEVMTDKIDMEVEAPADGKVEQLLAAPGAVLEIGKPVLIMETATQVLSFDFDGPAQDETPAPVAAATTPAAVPAPAPVVPAPVAVTPAAPVIVNENPKSVPAARNLAAEKGINLQTINPTGPFETITYEDVTNANIDPAITKRQQAELRDQLKLQVLRNKRTFHHHEQILRDAKVEPHGDKEYEQIYLNELPQVVRFRHLQSEEFQMSFRQLLRDYSGQG